MLTPFQIELIHGEIDGANTPNQSAEVARLIKSVPEAQALMTSLRSLDALISKVPERVPSARVTQLIHSAMPVRSKASQSNTFAQSKSKRNRVSTLMEEWMSTKKVLIVATTAVAAIAIIGQLIVGYKPSAYDAGTVGAGSGMGGVEKAGRFRGRTMTEADVTLSNPEIRTLLQNDKVLKLVQSKAFKDAMHDPAFQDLLNSEALHALESQDAFHDIMASDASYNVLLVAANEASHNVSVVAANDASHQVQAVAANDLAHQVLSTEVYNQILNSDALHGIMNNEALHGVLASDSFHDLLANNAFHEALASDALHAVLANDALQNLLASDVFQSIAHDASLADLFLNEAGRIN